MEEIGPAQANEYQIKTGVWWNLKASLASGHSIT
jgi:hypothetical protein